MRNKRIPNRICSPSVSSAVRRSFPHARSRTTAVLSHFRGHKYRSGSKPLHPICFEKQRDKRSVTGGSYGFTAEIAPQLVDTTDLFIYLGQPGKTAEISVLAEVDAVPAFSTSELYPNLCDSTLWSVDEWYHLL
jgi:hypothetical protein